MAEEAKKESTTGPGTTASGTVVMSNKPAETTLTSSTGVATGANPQDAGGGGMQQMLFMIVPMIIIFYLLIIRPEKKRQQQQKDLLSGVKKNDKVVLAGIGIYGTVADIDGNDVTLIIDTKKDVRIKVRKEAIGQILTDDKK